MNSQDTNRVVKAIVKLLRPHGHRLGGMSPSLIARELVNDLYAAGWDFKITPYGVVGMEKQVEMFLDREYPEEEKIQEEQPNEAVEEFRKEFVEVSEMDERQIIRSEIEPEYIRIAFAHAKHQAGNEWMFKVRHILALAKDLKENHTKCRKGHMSDGKGHCIICKAKL